MNLKNIIMERWTSNPLEEQALAWWATLTLDQQQTEVYHYCTMHEISPLHEFDVESIISIWDTKINKQ